MGAGARASVGIKAGRYMFEIKVLGSVSTSEPPSAGPQPRHMLRIGFSTADAPLVGDTETSVFFDSEGDFVTGKKKKKVGVKFNRDDVIAIVLNANTDGTNAGTLTLFVNGVAAAAPQELPEQLKGKALHPCITFRNIAMTYNFGPEPLTALPFKCRMVQDAAQKDVTVKAPPLAPKDGKYDVLFPACLPDEGAFDWLDSFLQKNKQYTELSN